jgi:hypothetical protein
MEDPEQLPGVTDADHRLRQSIQHTERFEALLRGYDSANIDSTLPLHAMFFPSRIFGSLPDASKLPSGTPSSNLRLLSPSNGSMACTLRGDRAQAEDQNPVRWTTPSATSKRFKDSQALPPTGIELACPFYKSNPGGPHEKRCERGSWTSISKLRHVRKLS